MQHHSNFLPKFKFFNSRREASVCLRVENMYYFQLLFLVTKKKHHFPLSLSAQELELEDTQGRLQQDLRRRLAIEGKTDSIFQSDAIVHKLLKGLPLCFAPLRYKEERL